MAYLHAGSVKQVRRVVNAARRHLPVELIPAGEQADCKPRVVVRPTWILRERNRPALVPGLVVSEPPPRSLTPMAEILGELEAILRSGKHRYWSLDWLHSVSGMEWSQCAAILSGVGVPVDDGAVEMIVGARAFWDQLGEFRRIYANAVRLGQVEAAVGDWAFVEAGELPGWLSGLHVPKMQRREIYLVRVVSRRGPLLSLEFHGSPSYRPLFTVPL
jgi:hypothetical protein